MILQICTLRDSANFLVVVKYPSPSVRCFNASRSAAISSSHSHPVIHEVGSHGTVHQPEGASPRDEGVLAFYFSRVNPSAQANSLSSSFPLLAFR